MIWQEKKLYDQAVADCNEVLRIDPRNAQAYRKRAQIAWDQNQVDQALADYARAIELDPSNEHNFQERGDLLFRAKQDSAGALADYERAAPEPQRSSDLQRPGLHLLHAAEV